ncbi:hypothetical protein L6452_39066 [Arctium lappa]|uniref:Uncharacterized protein n=1 Tax=Arctium lappa TaxID=4217 RepID=A0ACB8XS12_ARCLA|nr:hypothetical protein L6452_39066 [Arctium lappa]
MTVIVDQKKKTFTLEKSEQAFNVAKDLANVKFSLSRYEGPSRGPRNAPASCVIISGKVAYYCFIYRFDFNDWKLLKGLVTEGSELMPHRTD